MNIIIIPLTQLIALLFMMRFYMRFCFVGGNAPLASLIAKATNPLTYPLNLVLPKFSRLDLPALIIAYAALIIQSYIIFSAVQIDSQSIFLSNVFFYAMVKTAKLFINLIFFAILAKVILSWVSPEGQSPISAQLFNPLTDWVLEPIRRIIPTMGMVDFSPIIALFALQFIENFLLNKLLIL